MSFLYFSYFSFDSWRNYYVTHRRRRGQRPTRHVLRVEARARDKSLPVATWCLHLLPLHPASVPEIRPVTPRLAPWPPGWCVLQFSTKSTKTGLNIRKDYTTFLVLSQKLQHLDSKMVNFIINLYFKIRYENSTGNIIHNIRFVT